VIEAHNDDVRKSAAVLLKGLALHGGLFINSILLLLLNIAIDDMQATILECSRLHQLVRRGDDDKGTTGASCTRFMLVQLTVLIGGVPGASLESLTYRAFF
jgi:hypothetical protein